MTEQTIENRIKVNKDQIKGSIVNAKIVDKSLKQLIAQ